MFAASTCLIYTGNPARDPRVLSGKGMQGRIYLKEGVRYHSGELLTGDSTGYLVIDAADGRIKWIAVAGATQVWFPVWSLRYVIPSTPEQYAGLREASRYSYGLSAEGLATLLAASNQASVDTVRSGTGASEAEAAAAAFLTTARAATARYRSADAAAADGFKRVGTEFPFMGEHWVNLPRVLENRFDAAAPSVLIYVVTPSGRELAGVAYSALLADKEQPPKSVAPASAWHEHNGAIVDESLPGQHGGHRAAPDGTRLAVLHAWAWASNPAGPFVTDNEALPLLRTAAPPAKVDPLSLRGLTLAQDSAGYYLQTLRTALEATDAESRKLEAALDRHRALAGMALRDDARLRGVWESLWTDLDRTLPSRSARLRDIRRRLEGD